MGKKNVYVCNVNKDAETPMDKPVINWREEMEQEEKERKAGKK